MNLFSRHKNTVALAIVLLIQLLALGVQVKKQTADGPVRTIRLLTVDTIATFERALLHTGAGVRGVWSNYFDLRHVRRENQRLKEENDRMRLERVREQEEIRQAHRVYALLAFKQQWIDTTVAAQVIGTSGMETSRLLYLDKGAKDGIRPDMPVITPDGVVGKVLAVFGDTSQVLMINDPTSGVGALLVNSRLQGVVKGTPTGGVMLDHIMVGETVQPGEPLVTSGGDRVFPKGLPIGTVLKWGTGHNLMLDIHLKPAADLNRLEEVLVITHQKAREPDTKGLGPIRASDILAEHLPSVPVPAANPSTPATGALGTPAPNPSTPTAGAPGTHAPAAAPVPAGVAPAPGSPAPGAAVPRPAVSGPAVPKPAIPRAAPAAPSSPALTQPASKPATTVPPPVTPKVASPAATPTVPRATALPKPASPPATAASPKKTQQKPAGTASGSASSTGNAPEEEAH